MRELEAKDFPSLEPLFDLEVPNHTMLFSTLLGRNPGVAVVDQWPAPNQCALRTKMSPTFLGNSPSEDFVHLAIEQLKQHGRLLVPVWSEDEIEKRGFSPPDNTIERLAFSNWDPEAADERFMTRPIPAECSLKRMSHDLLEKCLWRKQVITMCGSIEAFLEHGFGFCLVRGSEILAEVYAVFWGVGVVEIGAITQKISRKKGYATLAAFYLGAECKRKGYGIYWTCDRANSASAAVARKLGFREETPYVWLEYV